MKIVAIGDLHLCRLPIYSSSNIEEINLLNFFKSLCINYEKIVLLGDMFHVVGSYSDKQHELNYFLMNYPRLIEMWSSGKFVWISGNHDNNLFDFQIEEYSIENSGLKYLFLHGHKFDSFLRNIITKTLDHLTPFAFKVSSRAWLKFWIEAYTSIYAPYGEILPENEFKHIRRIFLKNNDVVITGHSHRRELVRWYNCIYANPGRQYKHAYTYLSIDTSNNEISMIHNVNREENIVKQMQLQVD